MKVHVGSDSMYKVDVDVSQLLRQISTGRAILFTGAGFSKKTTNTDGLEPPLAKDLALEICRLGSFEEDEDLRYATDYYLSNCDNEELVKLLKRKFTLNQVSPDHEIICNLDWRRFYTTNYDRCIEISAGRVGKVVECIDIDMPPHEYYRREGICVHLNGSVNNLTGESLNKEFKLSTSSYISADSFLTSDWHYCFKKDLERSSAIVFVGYSMYDVEIQKILYENESLKEKTYFIVGQDPSPKSSFTLSKFGKVLPIGVDGFSKAIGDNADIFQINEGSYNLQSLCLYELSDVSRDIRDSNVETMLLYGDIDDGYVDSGVVGDQRIPYLVLREQLEQVVEFTKDGRNTVVYGDLGNGKSMFLRELKAYLTVNSVEVYYISDWDGDYVGDIDYLSSLNKEVAIIVDSYERYVDMIKHFAAVVPSNLRIIASARTAEHERLRSELKEVGFDFNEVGLDVLSEAESSSFVDIFDNLGIWGDNAGLSKTRKIELLSRKSSLQISLALLYLFEAPQIKEKISQVISGLFEIDSHKDTVFAICLLEVLDLRPTFSLVSEVAGNDAVYNVSVRNNESFRNLFKLSSSQVVSKSSLFCLSLINNHYSSTYITSKLLEIAKKFNKYKKKDFEQDRIFKSMLRFSSVERLLPGANKLSNLNRYYEDLKVAVPWLKNDPHFWLQYGMANIAYKEYGKAQQFIDQAYAIANKKDNYHTSNIDTQQARLFLVLAMRENVSSKIYELFQKAHKLLSSLDNDIYKFRQINKYRDFFEDSYSKLSRKNKTAFKGVCERLVREIEIAESRGEIDIYQQRSIGKAKNNLIYMVDKMGSA